MFQHSLRDHPDKKGERENGRKRTEGVTGRADAGTDGVSKEVDSEHKQRWIQVDSSGFEWIRRETDLKDVAAAQRLSM